ncbi:putative HAD superfamily hydrolase [Babesia divergens]|uniref:HAD superfamily hydrolase n=1 Tax=Babesia divergens TaxID=32595 RepID=A0AAD9GCE3_BABDI|nr:putative HAD superfamily hydrolase [Babesia divergens]
MCTVSKQTLPVRPPKHFAVDIDGTFLSFNDTQFAKNKKAFEKALKAGYNVFFCTGSYFYSHPYKFLGRPYTSSMAVLDDDFVRSTGYRGFPGVYHNGGVVYDGNGNVLRLSHFGASFMSQFCDYIVAHNLEKYVVFCDMLETYMLCEESTLMKPALADIDVLSAPTVVTRDMLLDMKISLLIISDSNILTNQTNLQRGVDYVLKEGSLGTWDVTPCGVTKAQGLKVLLDSYGCSSENCGFIGNGTNDIEAMTLTDISFAVDNASEDVKAYAKYTLAENNDEGAFHKAMEIVYGISPE